MYGVQLEAFGWMGAGHGHHHERDLTQLRPVEQSLLGICFNPETMKKAKAKGVDAEKARQAVRDVLDAAFREAPDRPANHPANLAEVEDRSPDLKAYNALRRELASSLVIELKQQALKGTTCKLLMQGGYQPEIAQAADGFSSSAYGRPPEKVLEVVRTATAKVPADWRGEFPCFIRLGMGVPANPEQLRAIVLAVKEGGSTVRSSTTIPNRHRRCSRGSRMPCAESDAGGFRLQAESEAGGFRLQAEDQEVAS